ncbi:MAG: PhoH family protein [Ignavibacteriae bacterium]|nr:PhoH family protein [Ignavibacteriota bacterium]
MESIERRIKLPATNLLVLFGANDSNLRLIEQRLEVTMIARGDTMILRGEDAAVDQVERIIKELIFVVNKTDTLSERDVTTVMDIMTSGTAFEVSPEEVDNVVLYAKQDYIKAKTAGQIAYMKAVRENDIVFAIGPAGTGKTYLAVAAAVASLRRHEVGKIVLARPAVEAGESLGFLPGDLREKVDPYLRPLYDALDDMLPSDRLKAYIERRTVEIVPLAYMRGRTLNNAFIILDEAQNATSLQMKMFLTRLGGNSRAIITGDITQIDLPSRTTSGLVEIREILHNIEGVSFVYFDKADVVRHKLVKDIINAYERYHENDEHASS